MPGGLDVVNRRNYYLQVGKRKRKPRIESSGTALRPHRNGNGTPRRGTLQCCTGLVEQRPLASQRSRVHRTLGYSGGDIPASSWSMAMLT